MAVKKTTERKKAVRRKKAEEVKSVEENPVVDYLVLFRDQGGEWRWQAKSNNGKVVEASSEGFVNRHYAWNRAKRLFPDAPLKHE